MMNSRRLSGVLVAALLGAASVRSAEYYVSTGGDNGNAGSQAAPWRTIQYAVTYPGLLPGDEIRVAGGTYGENVSIPVTATNGFILKGGFNVTGWGWDPANHPTIVQAANAAADVIDVRQKDIGLVGLTLTAGRRGVYAFNITATPYPHITVSHCIIRDNTSDGIYVVGGRCGLKARNCLIRNNGGYGIYLNVDNGAVKYIYHCTIVNNTAGGYYDQHTYGAVAYLRNCVIADNGGYSLRKDVSEARVRVYQSCVYGGALGNFMSRTSGVMLYDGLLSADPAFVGGTDYSLNVDSPCVARGADLSADANLAVTDDLTGAARTAPFDMGCYRSPYAQAPTYAATYVNAARADDSGAGTNWVTAKKRINAALAITAPAGACHVAEGSYAEEVVVSRLGVTLAGTNAAATLISGGGMQAAAWVVNTNVTVRGVTVTGATNGLFLAGASVATGITIDQCVSRGNCIGVFSPTDYMKNDYLIFTRCIMADNRGDGLQLWGKVGVKARNCLIEGNGGHGLRSLGDNGNPLYVYNCTVAGNSANGIYLNHNYAAPLYLRNTAVTHNGGWGIARPTANLVDNLAYSCFFANGSGNFQQAPTLGLGMVYLDPGYVGGGDYHVQSGAPLVDNGTDLSANANLPVTDDLDGVARTAPFDIGAYQSPYIKPVSRPDMYADALNGNDAWAGTNWVTAKQTIGAALTLTTASGTCHVAAGTYNEEVAVSLTGQTLEGADRRTTFITGSGGTVVFLQATNTTVRNFTLGGGLYGVQVASGSIATNVRVERCVLAGNTYGVGITFTSPTTQRPVMIDRCVISNNMSHAINWTGGKDYVDVRNCLIVRNGGYAFYTPQDNAHDHYFYACTIADNARGGLKGDHIRGYVAPMHLRNCIFSGNGGYAVERLREGWPGAERVYHSCFYGNTLGHFAGPAYIQGGVIAADPQFVDGGDYRLKDGSSCVDAGMDLSGYGITTDLDGNPRSAPFDIGCYESAYSAPARHAATYVDGAAGVDSQAGTTPAAPKRTIGAALAITAAGGTCHVGPGAYAEQVFLSPAGVTLEGAGSASVVVTAATSRATWKNGLGDLFSSNWYAVVWMQDTNTTLRGVSVAGAENGVLLASAPCSGSAIDQCKIQGHLRGIAVQLDKPNVQFAVTRCVLANNAESGLHMDVDCGLTAVNCLVAGNGGHGIRSHVDYSTYVHNLKHCTIADNATNGYWSSHQSDNAAYFTNCIVSGNGVDGILQDVVGAGVPSKNIYVNYSCVFDNGGMNVYSENGRIVVGASSVTNASPRFKPGLYTLMPGSPCIDEGVEAGVAVDLVGGRRPIGRAPDMGAYESPPPGTVIMLQ